MSDDTTQLTATIASSVLDSKVNTVRTAFCRSKEQISSVKVQQSWIELKRFAGTSFYGKCLDDQAIRVKARTYFPHLKDLFNNLFYNWGLALVWRSTHPLCYLLLLLLLGKQASSAFTTNWTGVWNYWSMHGWCAFYVVCGLQSAWSQFLGWMQASA